MRLFAWFFLFLGCAFAGETGTSFPEDAAVKRAELDLGRVEQLVSAGVLPRVKLDQARNALADAQDDATIRKTLYEKDISVDEADRLVEITQKRIERHQRTVDERNKLLEQGIIAKAELGDEVATLDRAKQEHEWALTRAKLAREMADLARNEQEIMRQLEASSNSARSLNVEHFSGNGKFDLTAFSQIDRAFEKKFQHPLPVSAMGETEVHKALGFDHRNRVDVALMPDEPEGRWLRQYLTSHDVPYFAFRSAVAHKATGAHIHIGPASQHYVAKNQRPQQGARIIGTED